MASAPPSTEDLQAFVTIADVGTLSGAAERLGLPKSTVSRRLARLEADLHVRLFTRNRQRLRLTSQGLALLEQARDALGALQALSDAASLTHAAPRGPLRVSIPRDLLAFHDVWLDFAVAHPSIALELSPTNRYVDLIAEGFDLALRGGRGDDTTLVARKLGTYGLVAVASPDYVRRHGKLTAPADLRHHSCALLAPMRHRPGHPDRPPLPHRHIICEDANFALKAALRGLGVAILPPHMVAAHIDQGALVCALDAYNPLRVPLYAVYPERAYLRAAVVAFIDHAAARFAQDAATSV